ncbi:MAG: arginine repressor [Blastocatellia bacterium]|nr:arginine repressor [Blastocatellia bacterium]
MKRKRQQKILEVISAKPIATQQELAAEITRRGVAATQSSVSRDIVELGLTKVNGYYAAPQMMMPDDGPIMAIETAGDNLIVLKTEIGQAQPTALAIDRANMTELVGTLAGDDTIFIAVKNSAAQRLAINKITEMFAHKGARGRRSRARGQQKR